MQTKRARKEKMKPYDKSLIDFLSGESGFIVPPFQRRYEWSKDQCEILFNDIFKTAYKNPVPDHAYIHFFWNVHSEF